MIIWEKVKRIFTNNGFGVFTEINPDSLTPVQDSFIVLGDIDGDSDLDLILTGQAASDTAKIYQNDGNGGFAEINPGSLQGVQRLCCAHLHDSQYRTLLYSYV